MIIKIYYNLVNKISQRGGYNSIFMDVGSKPCFVPKSFVENEKENSTILVN